MWACSLELSTLLSRRTARVNCSSANKLGVLAPHVYVLCGYRLIRWHVLRQEGLWHRPFYSQLSLSLGVIALTSAYQQGGQWVVNIVGAAGLVFIFIGALLPWLTGLCSATAF